MMGGAAAKPEAPAAPTVIYLAMDDLYEAKIAKHWTDAIGGRVVFGLPMQRLPPNLTIIPIVRGSERTPVRSEEFDPVQQKMRPKIVPEKTLTGEIRECTPVNVRDYWTAHNGSAALDDGFGEAMSGELDEPSLINAITNSTIKHDVMAKTHPGQPHKLFLAWV